MRICLARSSGEWSSVDENGKRERKHKETQTSDETTMETCGWRGHGRLMVINGCVFAFDFGTIYVCRKFGNWREEIGMLPSHALTCLFDIEFVRGQVPGTPMCTITYISIDGIQILFWIMVYHCFSNVPHVRFMV